TRLGWYAQQVPDPAATVGGYLDAAPGPLAALARELAAFDPADPAQLDGYATAQERFAQQGGWAYQARVEAVLARLEVDRLPRDAPLGRLSGGEQARVMLAQVLLGEPTVLVLDEPTNHLDSDGTAWLGRYFAEFPGALLVVTHDRAFLDAFATRIFELDGIHDELQTYEGNYTAYRAEKQRRWERMLLDYEAQEKARRRLAADIEATKGHALSVEETFKSGPGMDHARRLAKKVAKKAKVRERRLERQMRSVAWLAEPSTRPGLVLAFPPAVPDGELVVKVADLVVDGRLRVPDLSVRAGERVLVTGRNGAGKTTLLRALASPSPAVARYAPVALLPQTHDALRLDVTVLGYFRSQVPMYVDEAGTALEGYLFDADQQAQPLRTLSAGELRRLLLATMVNSGAPVLLLDEPTNFLDFDALDVVERALREFRGTLVMVTHDRYFAEAVGYTRCLSVVDGRLASSPTCPG
ncbi:MAG TPA: ATP-binding cassette domain-containing protein, partial [Rugosimonospora sp.]|nr:ATP-binding cassette domain-containing protein [Rugosimonospora sp.]